jgi:hypothetical protein
MSGVFHLRMVAGSIIALCGLLIVLQAVVFFLNGRLANPGSLIGPIVDIAVVVWLCRGSKVAAYILSALLIIGLAVWVMWISAGILEEDTVTVGFGALGFIASGYGWWAVTLSTEVRAELARRRENHLARDREERRKFYQEMGETMPD